MHFYENILKRRNRINIIAFLLAFTISLIILTNGGKNDNITSMDDMAPGTNVTTAAAEDDLEVEQAAKRYPSVDIDADTILDIDGYRYYDFTKTVYAGCGLDGTVRQFEMYYGLCAEADGSKITVTAYSHMDGVEPDFGVLINNAVEKYVRFDIDKPQAFDVKRLPNGDYTLGIQFTNKETCYTTVYINDGEVWFAKGTQLSVKSVQEEILDRRAKLQKLVASHGVTSENASDASTETVAYPTYAGRGDSRRCDTDLWRELAHKIVPDNTLSDTVKLTLIHDWMTANLSYDYYKVYRLDSSSRANYYRDWSGTQNVYNTKTGICRDFTNIFGIMSRELGIPCSSLDTDTHTWTIVYLNGIWQEIDVTADIDRSVYGKDVNDVKNTDMTVRYTAFLRDAGRSDLNDIKSVGWGIYTVEFAKTGSHKT